MRQAWNGSIELDTAQTAKAEIPKECPHRRDEFFGGVFSTLLHAIQQECANVLSTPSTDKAACAFYVTRETTEVCPPRLRYRADDEEARPVAGGVTSCSSLIDGLARTP